MLQIKVFRQLKGGQICVINHLQEIRSQWLWSQLVIDQYSQNSIIVSNQVKKKFLAVQVFFIIFSFPTEYKWTLTDKYFIRGDS